MDDEVGPAPGNNVEPRGTPALGDGRTFTVEDLVVLNRATTVSQVLPGVAHDLSNAMQIVAGLVELLAARGQLAPDALEKVARIGEQATRAVGLVRNLVAFSRCEEAGVRAVDVARVVEQVLGFRRYHLGRARIAVDLRGIAPGQCVVRTDGHRLAQLLLNLVLNAERALAGGPQPRMTVELEQSAETLAIAVLDNGAPLTQGTDDVAAALRLTTAQALAQMLGGDISVEPMAGGGTRASLRLPRP
jgi:signal transduction histidine kinase